MKMKQVLILALCAMLFLTACGPKEPASGAESTAAGTGASEALNLYTEQNVTEETSKPTQAPTEEPEPELPALSEEAAIEPTVLYDENDVRITALELGYSEEFVEIKLQIENNSEMELEFISESLGYSVNSVNGYIIVDGYLDCFVAAGKKANETISFDKRTLQMYGIQVIADMELGFEIYDDDSNSFVTGPQQIKTSAYEAYDYETDFYQNSLTSEIAQNVFGYTLSYFSEAFAYDDAGIRGCSAAVRVDPDGKQVLALEFENTTDQIVTVRAVDLALNGLVVDSSTCGNIDLTPGKKGVMDVGLISAVAPELQERFGLRELGSIECTIKQNDVDWEELGQEVPVAFNLTESVAEIDVSGTELYNSNGVRIISKGIFENISEFGEDISTILLIENTSGTELDIVEEYGSLSVNDMMTEYYFDWNIAPNGRYGFVSIFLLQDSLNNNEISSAAEIANLEFRAEIYQNGEIMDTPTLKIAYK